MLPIIGVPAVLLEGVSTTTASQCCSAVFGCLNSSLLKDTCPVRCKAAQQRELRTSSSTERQDRDRHCGTLKPAGRTCNLLPLLLLRCLFLLSHSHSPIKPKLWSCFPLTLSFSSENHLFLLSLKRLQGCFAASRYTVHP